MTVLSATLGLRQIAVLGAASILLVHATVHAGHLRLTYETGASMVVVAAAALLSVGAIVLTLIDSSRSSFAILEMLAGVIVASFRLRAVDAAARTPRAQDEDRIACRVVRVFGKDKKRRLGADADQPHRLRHSPPVGGRQTSSMPTHLIPPGDELDSARQ